MREWPWHSRERRDRELNDEIQARLDMAKRDRIERGEPPEIAELGARREFGNRTLTQEVTRQMWRWHLLETLWQDVRYSVRLMRRAPAFTAIAVLSLALGIGANTAIFSLINTLMLRLLPVANPEQLVELLQKYPGEPRGNGWWSSESYRHFHKSNHTLSGLVGFRASRFAVRREGSGLETLDGQYVTGNFFPVLGVQPALGRLLAREDDPAVAVLSWSYWDSRFGRDPAILGRRITVDNTPVTVVGVAPRKFLGLTGWSQPNLWIPMNAGPSVRMGLVGRLKPGVSLQQARAELSVLFRFTIEERATTSKDPLIHKLTMEVEPAATGVSFLRDQYATPLLLLMSVVGLLLLVACTNLASLLLARAAARENEMALRVSLGAGRLRLVRQLLTETLLLSIAGSLLGICFAYFGADALLQILASGRQIPASPDRLEIPIHTDEHVLAFTAGLAVLSGLLFGLAPAVRAWGTSPMSSLRDGGRASGSRFRSLFGRSLVVAQVAFSVVLLSAAGLFVRYLWDLKNLNLGFRSDHLLLVTVDSTRSGYKPEQLAEPFKELLSRLNALPGIRSATLCAPTPISGAGASRFATVEGHRERPEDRRYVSVIWAAPKYFKTLGIPLIAGRDFSLEDKGQSHVAIINQTMAHHYFSGDPLGKHITFDDDDKPYEIVGLVGDAKYYEIREAPRRTVYMDAFQNWDAPSHFVLRTALAPSAVIPDVRRVVGYVLKTVTIAQITTMTEQVDASIVPERLIATLSGLFGVLGSMLAAIGLYGLLAYTVARRVGEIGIRMALGGSRMDMTWMVLKDAVMMAGTGLAIGIVLAFGSERLAGGLIHDLPLQSAAPIVFGSLAMMAVALISAYVPARRAARIDPIESLRYE